MSKPASKKITVLNTDVDMLSLMDQVLSDRGYEVKTRRDWQSAYRDIRSDRPDLLILDVLLDKEERGYQLVDMLTLDPVTRSMPVIICTTATRSLEERASALRRAGVLALEKPFDLDELVALIRRALEVGDRQLMKE